ncbi:MAG: hypothetical protein Q9160_006538 [Pyrenula sp. 1 TL-2023]
MLRFLLELTLLLGTLFLWVTGQLDPVQKRLQEILLDVMGETKLSYGVKKSLTGKKLIEDENLSMIQNTLGGQVSGVFGKGGAGHGLGVGLSKKL